MTAAVAIARGDDDYPAALLDLPEPPAILWRIGSLDLLQGPVVAIVGTRQATLYGERVTREIAGALARAGASVVSGMARGIDGVAHVAALDAGGRTVAVLGTGVDIAYPPSHRALHRRIATSGLLLSELPPGAHSHGGSFPQRNRLIAALARLTIIVEAPIKSGALITASLVSGGIYVGGTHAEIQRLRDFGRAIGLAFQIVDDVLDVTQSSIQLGKTAGKDTASEKATYPALFGIEESERKAEALVTSGCNSLESFGQRAQTLKELARFLVQRKK